MPSLSFEKMFGRRNGSSRYISHFVADQTCSFLAVRPDRDFIGKQQALRLPQIKKTKAPTTETPKKQEKEVDTTKSSLLTSNQDDLIKKLPVEMRTMLMNLLNIEIKVNFSKSLILTDFNFVD